MIPEKRMGKCKILLIQVEVRLIRLFHDNWCCSEYCSSHNIAIQLEFGLCPDSRCKCFPKYSYLFLFNACILSEIISYCFRAFIICINFPPVNFYVLESHCKYNLRSYYASILQETFDLLYPLFTTIQVG